MSCTNTLGGGSNSTSQWCTTSGSFSPWIHTITYQAQMRDQIDETRKWRATCSQKQDKSTWSYFTSKLLVELIEEIEEIIGRNEPKIVEDVVDGCYIIMLKLGTVSLVRAGCSAI